MNRWSATALCPILALGLLLVPRTADGGVIVRQELEPGVFAAIEGGRMAFIECRPPKGDAGKALLQKYLADPNAWHIYRDRIAVAIPFAKLNPKAQRRVIEAVFPQDYADESGWRHTVTYGGADGMESYFALAEWLTGLGTNYNRILSLEANQSLGQTLTPGQQVFIPSSLLLPVMRTPSPRPVRQAAPPPAPPAPRSGPTGTNGDLEYGSDPSGAYAIYRLKKGEAIYTSVAVRFTDFQENADVQQACDVILRRSGIQNPRKLNPGQKVVIPLEMLSDRYQPAESNQRRTYEAVRQQAEVLRTQRFGAEGLEGVVVILDPGHGGRDHGASHLPANLYEDELTYDIVCRIRALLESRTRARVYVTLEDPDQGGRPSESTRFVHDTDEYLLTTPRYLNQDAKISANLRWYLTNEIYRKELKNGVDERKVLFASVHCDALFNGSLSGAMVYVPGADYRRDREQPAGAVYASYQEVRVQPVVTTSSSTRQKDEALSYNFAHTLLKSLAAAPVPVKVHDTGDPIRNVIRQSGGRAYVPAVLRNTMVPTKVLVETANLTNAEDRASLADPKWRQRFAEAFVVAVQDYFD